MKIAYASLVVLLGLSVCVAQDKPRVFMAGHGTVNGMTKGAAGGTGSRAGWWAAGRSDSITDSHDESMELSKDFVKECTGAQVTVNADAADYVTALNRESKSKKGIFSKNDQIQVSNKAGDVLLSSAVRSVSNAAKDACSTIMADFEKNGHAKPVAAAQPAAPVAEAAARVPGNSFVQGGAVAISAETQLEISSTPDGADISIDGGFVGNTPSTVSVAPGEHTVSVQMQGYQAWQRSIKTSGGKVKLSAVLPKGK